MSTPGPVPGKGRTFRFEASSGEIHGRAGTARLAPQPASLLTLLMERSGEVVARAEIETLLWPAGGVDVDQGIAFALREVRKGLEEAGCDPGIVETIPRRGYRLRAEAPTHATDVAPTGVDGRDPSVWRRSRLVAAAGIIAVLAALTTTYLPWSADPPVIALLEHQAEDAPLAGLAGELGTTLTAVLTDSLAGLAGIVGPTGTASLGGANDVGGARRELGACLLASGVISAIGSDSVRIFTQMVRTADRVHAWASVDTLAAEELVARTTTSVLEGARAALAGC